MTAAQQREVKIQFEQLLEETEGFEDALQYIGDIAGDLDLPVEDVREEIRTVWGQ